MTTSETARAGVESLIDELAAAQRHIAILDAKLIELSEPQRVPEMVRKTYRRGYQAGYMAGRENRLRQTAPERNARTWIREAIQVPA